METLLKTIKGLDPLVLGLAGVGLAIIVVVLLVNAVQLRRAKGRADDLERPVAQPSATRAGAAIERVERPDRSTRIEPSFTAPSVPTAQAVVSHEAQFGHDTDVSFGGAAQAAAPTQPPAQLPTAQMSEADPDVVSLATPTNPATQPDPPLVVPGGPREPTAPIDGRVHSIVKLRFDRPLAPDQAKGITERVTADHRRSHAWIWSSQGGAWAGAQSPAAGANPADAIAFAMPLATRHGAVTESTLRDWMGSIERVGHEHEAEVVYAPINDDAKRAVELDQFCSNLDLIAGVTLMRADRSAIPGTRVRGTLEAEGFRLVPEGFFELVADDGVHPIYEIRSTHGQAMTSEALRQDGVHGLSLTLDVMRVPNPVQQFDLMKSLAKRLAPRLEATIVDDRGHALTDALFAQIRLELEKRVTAARTAGIEPGSPLARTLFGD
jgi:hypothetical protein